MLILTNFSLLFRKHNNFFSRTNFQHKDKMKVLKYLIIEDFHLFLISYSIIVHSMGTKHFILLTFLHHLHALNSHRFRNLIQNCLLMYESPRKGFRLQFSEKTVLLSTKLFIQTVYLNVLFFNLLKSIIQTAIRSFGLIQKVHIM